MYAKLPFLQASPVCCSSCCFFGATFGLYSNHFYTSPLNSQLVFYMLTLQHRPSEIMPQK